MKSKRRKKQCPDAPLQLQSAIINYGKVYFKHITNQTIFLRISIISKIKNVEKQFKIRDRYETVTKGLTIINNTILTQTLQELLIVFSIAFTSNKLVGTSMRLF